MTRRQIASRAKKRNKAISDTLAILTVGIPTAIAFGFLVAALLVKASIDFGF